jgi:hypothetical protein
MHGSTQPATAVMMMQMQMLPGRRPAKQGLVEF